MTRFIKLANNIEISESEYLAAQLPEYNKNPYLASLLIAAIRDYCTYENYDFRGYVSAKSYISCYLNVDMCEVSRLCIVARKVSKLFDIKNADESRHTMTVQQLIDSLLTLPNRHAYISFYAPESPCPVKSVHAPSYDQSHVYLDYKA